MTIKLDIGKKGLRKAWDSEKMTKCTTNDSNVVHLYHKMRKMYHKVRVIYYINVPQIEGGEKMYAIEALVREKHLFRQL